MVSVYQAALDLLRQSQVHPEIAAQVLAYLFFFSSTLLFNQLLDKGEGLGWALETAPEDVVPRSGRLDPWGSRLVLWGRQVEAQESRRCYRACPHRSRSLSVAAERPREKGVVACTGPSGLSWFPLFPHRATASVTEGTGSGK